MSLPTIPHHWLSLPNEILNDICSQLTDRDIKNLRLTCSHFKEVVPLRLDRVFISANPRDVDVFSAIAAHDVLRRQVVEIIWDDALLQETGWFVGDEDDAADYKDAPKWFSRDCGESLWEITSSSETLRMEAAEWTKIPLLPISECWVYYQQLFQQQREVLQSGAHNRALEDAWRLRRFPNVRSVTVTPAAHGRLFFPLFKTPTIRAFPPGFVYPIPRGWPTSKDMVLELDEWEDAGDNFSYPNGNDWQGFRAVTSILARYPYDLTELRVDAFKVSSGLNVRMFEKPCRALADFITIITRPSFQRLHLDLMTGGQDQLGWPAFTSGHLARALSAAQLKSLSIRTDVATAAGYVEVEAVSPPSLSTIFTRANMSCLSHFGLSGFFVREDELMRILADLPHELLQTVELSFLRFDQELWATYSYDCRYIVEETFGHLLERIRDELPWQDVSLTVGDNLPYYMEGRAIWVNVDNFLHSGGANPFSADKRGMYMEDGFGVVKDLFDEAYERPDVSDERLEYMGYRCWGTYPCNEQCRW